MAHTVVYAASEIAAYLHRQGLEFIHSIPDLPYLINLLVPTLLTK